jgi:hypothetical protein
VKKKITFIFSALVATGMLLDLNYQTATGNSGGAPSGNTGSPGDGGNTCARSGCHSGGPAVGAQVASITSNIPANGYVPGETYEMTATMSNGGVKFGFSVSPQDVQGNLLGTLVATSATAINGSGKYITHTPSSNSGSGTKSWTFGWIAPAAGTGAVTFYGAFNFANNALGSSGDVIVSVSQTFEENTSTGISEQALASVAIFPNPAQGEINIRLSDVDEVIMVSMFAIDGRKVISEQFTSGDIKLNLAGKNINAGVYVLQIEATNSTVIRKIVVQ